MKVSLLHGGNTQAILKKLDEIVADFGEGLVVRAREKEINGEFVLNHFSGNELFGDRKLIILTNPDENLEVDQLASQELIELVLVYEKELGVRAKVLKQKKVLEGRVYNLMAPQDRRIWSLLDMVLEGDPRSFKLAGELIDEFGGQYLLTMMVFNLRRLVLAESAPGFVREKLMAKRREWGIGRIGRYYHDCLESDWKIKTGLADEKEIVSLMVINWVR